MATERHKTVIMLGAGASAASSYMPKPCMQGFFKNFKEHDNEELAAILSHYYGSVEIARNVGNVEDIMTYCESIISLHEQTNGERAELERARTQLDWYIHGELVIDNPSNMTAAQWIGETDRNLDLLFDSLLDPSTEKYRNTIITTNYDLLVDKSLHNPNKPHPRDALPHAHKLRSLVYTDSPLRGVLNREWWLGLPRESGILLKLNGSLAWAYCPFQEI